MITRIRHLLRRPRPAFTVRDEHDFPAAAKRVEVLVHVAIHHPDPQVREQNWRDASREASAISDWLAAVRRTVPAEHRRSVDAAYRDWSARVGEYAPVTRA